MDVQVEVKIMNTGHYYLPNLKYGEGCSAEGSIVDDTVELQAVFSKLLKDNRNIIPHDKITYFVNDEPFIVTSVDISIDEGEVDLLCAVIYVELNAEGV